MRGGLDDALHKLARRDELRRRAAGEATGTPPAVQELVEAIAGVVGRNSHLEVTVGVEGDGEPTLLHFFVEDGQVQVTADTTVATRIGDPGPKHADFEVEVEEPVVVVEEPIIPAYAPPPPRADAGDSTRRISYDDRDRYDPGTGYDAEPFSRYERPSAFPASDARPLEFPVTDARPSTFPAADPRPSAFPASDKRSDSGAAAFLPSDSHGPAGDSRASAFPTGDSRSSASDARRDARSAAGDARRDARSSAFPASDAAAPENPYRSPFAATPPPEVPPQTSRRLRAEQHRALEEPVNGGGEPTNGRRAHESSNGGHESTNGGWIRAEHHRAPEEPSASERAARPVPEQRGMPAPLPEPIPLNIDSKETEQAAKRLAALLRDNPTLLRPGPPD